MGTIAGHAADKLENFVKGKKNILTPSGVDQKNEFIAQKQFIKVLSATGWKKAITFLNWVEVNRRKVSNFLQFVLIREAQSVPDNPV